MSAQEEFQAWINHTGQTLVCPACGGIQWSVVRSDLAIPDAGGKHQPVFLIKCDHCGHQRFFSPNDPGGELQAG